MPVFAPAWLGYVPRPGDRVVFERRSVRRRGWSGVVRTSGWAGDRSHFASSGCPDVGSVPRAPLEHPGASDVMVDQRGLSLPLADGTVRGVRLRDLDDESIQCF